MKDRHAHSLIEMLVVLIIVGVLIAIVVPAVQRARESTRMAQCIHNQGQLAKAVHMHVADEPYGRFPGYRAFAADGTTAIGWAPQIFEYLGKSDQPEDPNAATYLEILVCPSDQGPKDKPRLNYVVNGGQPDTDSPADGIFFDHAKAEKVYVTKDDFRDGLTNTILLAENLDATEWTVTDEANQCILWPLTAGNEINNGTGARPSSHHPGGFVTAFADGSVKFLAERDINDDANIGTADSYYVALLTPGGDDTDAISGGPDEGGSGGSGSDPVVCGDTSTSPLDSLIAHYSFDDSGDLGADSSGNNHHGTVSGAVPDAERGGSALFDGDDIIDVPDEILCWQEGTVALWIRAPGYYADPGTVHAFSNKMVEEDDGNGVRQAHNRVYIGGFTYTPGNFLVGIDKDNGTAGNFTGFQLNQWHHIAVVWRADGTAEAYVDGASSFDYASAGYGATTFSEQIQTNVSIGAFQGTLNGTPSVWNFWTGHIDDVRVYVRALTAGDIGQLAN